MKLTQIASAALLASALAPSAQAHATLESPEAQVGSYYKAVIRIGHGCSGEDTQRLRVQIPEGVISVKPMPKPGWELTTTVGDYASSYDLHGRSLSEGVREISWSGTLAEGHYDEFTFRAKLDSSLPAGEMLFFPTVQDCASSENAWVEIPAAGQDPRELKRPAPGVKLLAPQGHSH